MIKRFTLLTLLLFLGLSLTGCIFQTTSSNEVGVRTRNFGFLGTQGIEDRIYQPASTYLILPYVNSWHTFNTNLQNIEMTLSRSSGDIRAQDDLRFKTTDGNDISLDLTISYKIIREKAPFILGFVAKNDQELRTKIIRTVVRSIPRDIFGELETEQFYKADMRAQQAEKAKVILNKILNPYGVSIESVLTKTYRYNPDYQQAIEDRKIAEQKTQKLISAALAKEEEYKRKLEEAKGEVNKMVAKVNGEYEKEKIAANAYYTQQQKIAKAIYAEGSAEAKAIKEMNQALVEQGGEVMVKLEIAKALKGKRIFLLPSNSSGGLNLQTLDVNRFLEAHAIQNIGSKVSNANN
ncbi:MAG: hypothetical protein CL521_06270 [Actinobacteria bacterium]|nr:hypothetical protein [Actinomycetota bacterium]